MVDQQPDQSVESYVRETQEIWDQKAAFWDERFGEGNQFQRVLIGPATERLLRLRPGERVLDIACGNGAFARRMASLGAQVVAFDLSASFLERASARTAAAGLSDRIAYRQLDATDPAQLLSLGEGQYDAAVASMALMDMPDIAPLAAALLRLLKPGGRFVFSVMHPAFNSLGASMLAEAAEEDGQQVIRQAMKVSRYLHIPPAKGVGMVGEPAPHYYFHRPLAELLGVFFAAGFVLDGLEEPAFPGDGEPLSWRATDQIPPVLAARLRVARG